MSMQWSHLFESPCQNGSLDVNPSPPWSYGDSERGLGRAFFPYFRLEKPPFSAECIVSIHPTRLILRRRAFFVPNSWGIASIFEKPHPFS